MLEMERDIYICYIKPHLEIRVPVLVAFLPTSELDARIGAPPLQRDPVRLQGQSKLRRNVKVKLIRFRSENSKRLYRDGTRLWGIISLR